MAEMGYKCEKCGKEYEVPPKWCPCEPFPMADPYSAYFLVEMEVGKEISFDNEFDMISLSSMIEEPKPFKSVKLLEMRDGYEFMPFVEDHEETDPLEIPFVKKEKLNRLEDTRTGFLLIKETFEAHVETLDYLGWQIVDLTKEEYEEFDAGPA